ncbi:MAG: hypothetical protein QOE46_1422 [Acidobacteriota bacterium]|nr:hypothetical protein [Acidobacteriota bacterium]
MQQRTVSPQRCIPSTRRGRAALPFAARPRFVCRTGHSSPHECRPNPHRGIRADLKAKLFGGQGPRARALVAPELPVSVRVGRGRSAPAVVTAVVTAVMPAVMTRSHRGATASVGRRAVCVLRERRACADDERCDECECDSELLHSLFEFSLEFFCNPSLVSS